MKNLKIKEKDRDRNITRGKGKSSNRVQEAYVALCSATVGNNEGDGDDNYFLPCFSFGTLYFLIRTCSNSLLIAPI